MAPKVKDIAGQQFGKATVLEFVGLRKHKAVWKCSCQCGNVFETNGVDLRSGNTTSCGCVKATIGKTSNLKHGASAGAKVTKTYTIYRSMIQRCVDPNSKSYPDYGGRGITVCERWRSDFRNFLADMGECPSDGSIERIDVNGPYSVENCKWIPKIEQARNTRKTVRYMVGETVMIQADTARHLGIHQSSLLQMRRENRLPANIVALTS